MTIWKSPMWLTLTAAAAFAACGTHSSTNLTADVVPVLKLSATDAYQAVANVFDDPLYEQKLAAFKAMNFVDFAAVVKRMGGPQTLSVDGASIPGSATLQADMLGQLEKMQAQFGTMGEFWQAIGYIPVKPSQDDVLIGLHSLASTLAVHSDLGLADVHDNSGCSVTAQQNGLLVSPQGGAVTAPGNTGAVWIQKGGPAYRYCSTSQGDVISPNNPAWGYSKTLGTCANGNDAAIWQTGSYAAALCGAAMFQANIRTTTGASNNGSYIPTCGNSDIVAGGVTGQTFASTYGTGANATGHWGTTVIGGQRVSCQYQIQDPH